MAIVGAGPVGLLLACLLAQRGIEVAVHERRETPATSSRAIGIHPPGLDALESAGVAGDILRHALRVAGGSAECGGAVLASLSLDSPGRASRTVLTLPQNGTEQILRHRLAELQPGALRWGVTVTDIVQDDHEVRYGAETPAGTRDLRARLLVAADGVRSGIRHRLGIRWRPYPGQADYLMMDVPADGAGSAWARLHLEPDGIVESFPLPEGRRWVVLDRSGAGPTAETIAAIIGRRTGLPVESARASMVSRFTARQHIAEHLVRGRIALLGDAAHEVSPIGGQGMNLGWMGALHLDAAIADALRHGRSGFGGYALQARRHARRAQRRAQAYMALGRPSTGAALATRNALIRSAGMPLTLPWLAGRITMAGV